MKYTAVYSLISILALVGSASAGGFVTPNYSTSGDSLMTETNATRWAIVERDNSYCCDFFPTEVDAAINQISASISINSGTLIGVDRTATTPMRFFAEGGFGKGNRLCFTPPIDTTVGFKVVLVSPSPQNVTMQCDETTLYGGFNTNANPFNFLEITNTTNSTINGRIFATNFDGTTVLNGSDFSVLPGRRVDINIHDATGPNVFGVLKIVHDGPLGALQANTSFYSGPVSNLQLRATVPAKIRDRR